MNPTKLSLFLITCLAPLMAGAQTVSPTNKDVPKLSTPFVAPGQTAAPTNKDVPKLSIPFASADQNNDGFVSRDEAKKVGVSIFDFDAADKNKDNKLNLSEWTLLRF
jgi:hypothetical protein